MEFVYLFRYDTQQNLRLYNQQGIEIDPDVAKTLAEGLLNTYGSLSEKEKKEQLKKQIEKELEVQAYWYGSPVEPKEFRKNRKGEWSFRCKACGEKVASNTHTEWFMIRGEFCLTFDCLEYSYAKCCSENCVNQLVKEAIHDKRIQLYKEKGLSIR